MKATLEGLFAIEGVRAAFLFDNKGGLLTSKAHAIYDNDILGEASKALETAISSLEVYHGGWASIIVSYNEGKLVLRTLTPEAFLAVVADADINLAFANVALNVALKKLKAAIAKGGLQAAAPSVPAAPPPAPPPPPRMAPTLPPTVSDSAVSTGFSGLTSSGLISSEIARAVNLDDRIKPLIKRLTKVLARHVGPMAKVFVKEAILRVATDGAFTEAHFPQLVDELSERIASPAERVEFRHKVLG